MGQPKRRRRIVWIVLGVLALIGLVAALRPKPLPVDVAKAARGPLRVTVDEDGKTRIKERYVVSAPLFGRLQRIELKPGATVEAGRTVMAVIEPSLPDLLDPRTRLTAQARVGGAQAALEAAKARLERARAAHELEKRNLARVRPLVPGVSVTQEERDRVEHAEWIAREELRAAQSAVQVAEYDLEQARAVLVQVQAPSSAADALAPAVRFEVRAPIDGKVLRVFQESAAVVPAGTRLLELGDPADLEVEIDVLSRDAVRIAPGARVYLEHWGGEGSLLARVRLVEPAAFLKISALGIEEQRVYVIADLVDPPEKRPRLGDAYRVEARIVVWESDDVLKVPAGALFRHEGGWAVFVAENGTARRRPLTVGANNGLEAVVLEGLAEGDAVILNPSDRVTDGAAVAPR
jgi:HlyD family secretion protein